MNSYIYIGNNEAIEKEIMPPMSRTVLEQGIWNKKTGNKTAIKVHSDLAKTLKEGQEIVEGVDCIEEWLLSYGQGAAWYPKKEHEEGVHIQDKRLYPTPPEEERNEAIEFAADALRQKNIDIETMQAAINRASKIMDEKDKELARCREALEWYADENNYLTDFHDCDKLPEDSVLATAWAEGRISMKAREALSSLPGKQEDSKSDGGIEGQSEWSAEYTGPRLMAPNDKCLVHDGDTMRKATVISIDIENKTYSVEIDGLGTKISNIPIIIWRPCNP